MSIRHINTETIHSKHACVKGNFSLQFTSFCCTPKRLECRIGLLTRIEYAEGQTTFSAVTQIVEAFPH